MQTPFVKMMSRISEIENYILKGLVLDEHGAWIPIADKKAVEEDFLAHLMGGQVLHEGRWVSIAEAKSARAPTEIATLATEMPLPAPDKKPLLTIIAPMFCPLRKMSDSRRKLKRFLSNIRPVNH
jgi:hypothetical protein